VLKWRLWLCLPVAALAADLPIREVTLYKHGVAHLSRSGELGPGESVELAFKASEMNDVLKSLTIVDASGAPVAGVRYDASDPVDRRLAEFPFRVPEQASLAAFLDQMKGARLELGSGVSGAIVSARTARSSEGERAAERELVVLLTDSGELRTIDLSTVSFVRFPDPKHQTMLRDYLAIASGARSLERRNVFIEGAGQGPRRLTARYLIPAAVWKSSYRLIFQASGEAVLEGWAIVDNTSGEDWTNVQLSVVSGRPISFLTQLYEPRYVERPRAELAEHAPAAPPTYEGAVRTGPASAVMAAAPPAPALLNVEAAEAISGMSTISPAAAGRDLGELFEYRFAMPVTVKQGESAMLPFLQQRVGARKLLIYSEGYGLNPRSAAELTNSTGKTLDGGPITVYDAGAYAGEALMETLKEGDKRFIAYGVDLGTRITTRLDSGTANVREVHLRRGVLTLRHAVQESRTYTITNVDANRKTLIIEHPLRPNYTLLSEVKPKEITTTARRFEVTVGGRATENFLVREERVYEQSTSLTNLTADALAALIEGRPLSAAGRAQLDRILAKKRELAENQAQLQSVRAGLRNLAADQERLRQNLTTLRGVPGQEALVQQYAGQLAASERELAAGREREARLERTADTLQSELNALLETAEF
jgi:hypothetical protein